MPAKAGNRLRLVEFTNVGNYFPMTISSLTTRLWLLIFRQITKNLRKLF